jgi:hypothetical protein
MNFDIDCLRSFMVVADTTQATGIVKSKQVTSRFRWVLIDVLATK